MMSGRRLQLPVVGHGRRVVGWVDLCGGRWAGCAGAWRFCALPHIAWPAFLSAPSPLAQVLSHLPDFPMRPPALLVELRVLLRICTCTRAPSLITSVTLCFQPPSSPTRLDSSSRFSHALPRSPILLCSSGTNPLCHHPTPPHPTPARLDSFSKFFSPGLRLGWAAGQPAVIDKLATMLQGHSIGASGITQVEDSDDLFRAVPAAPCYAARGAAALAAPCAAQPGCSSAGVSPGVRPQLSQPPLTPCHRTLHPHLPPLHSC